MSLNFKRNYPILLLLAGVLVGLTTWMGSMRIIAYTNSSATRSAPPVEIRSPTALFNDSLVHEIHILMPPADYDQMIKTFQATGEKTYYKADVIIDGARVNNVGIRLKGNASLMTAVGGPGARRMLGGPGGGPPAGMDAPNPPPGGEPPARPNLGGGPPGMPGSGQSGETKIPMMIKFNEYEPDQTYQGYTRLAVRAYGVSYDEAMLEEPLTNHAFHLMGLPAPYVAYAAVQLNDAAGKLYVISEVVDDPIYLARTFTNPDGVLYKAEVGSSLSYAGESPSAYANSFSQETRQKDADLAALIAFSRFVTEADDLTFERDLPTRLDIGAFAAYLAITNLLVNNDSIAGMNNNYYLYYDERSARMTLLYWDGNESLGGMGMGTSATFDLYFEDQRQMRLPGNRSGKQNILLQRFLANPTFRKLYEAQLAQVYRRVFASAALQIKADRSRYSPRGASLQRSVAWHAGSGCDRRSP